MGFQLPFDEPVAGVLNPFPFIGVVVVDLLFLCPPFCIVFSHSYFSFPSGLPIPRVEDFGIAVRESILFFNLVTLLLFTPQHLHY